MNEAYRAGVVSAMEKVAFSVTEEGHKFDTEMAKARELAAAREWEIGQKYKGVGRRGKMGNIGRALRGFQPGAVSREPRHEAYVARRHAKGENAWNPLGGVMTPSKYEKGGSKWQYGGFKTPKKD